MKLKRSFIELDLDLVDRDPNQPREDFDDAADTRLGRNIEENDLLQVPGVKRHPKIPGRYMIVWGERRVRALRLAGHTTYQLVLIEGDLSDSFLLSAMENFHRKDLNAIEEANLIYRLRSKPYEMKWGEIGNILDRDVQTLQTKLRLLDLPEEIQDMVRAGNLPQVGALNLAQYKGERGDQIRLAHDLVAGRKPLELERERSATRSRRILEGKVPRDPEELMRRILGLGWRLRSGVVTFRAFLELPDEERRRVWAKLPTSARAGLLDHLDVFAQLSDLFRKFSRTPEGKKVELKVPDLPAPVSGKQAAPPKPAPRPAPVPPPAAKPASAGRAPVRPPQAETVPRPAPQVMVQVLTELFGDSERDQFRVNLSLSGVGRKLDLDGQAGTVVRGTLKELARVWALPTEVGDPSERAFRGHVAKLRFSASSPTFHMFLRKAQELDRSPDPVSLQGL